MIHPADAAVEHSGPFHAKHLANTSAFMAKGAGPSGMQAVFTARSLTAFINYGAAYKILSV